MLKRLNYSNRYVVKSCPQWQSSLALSVHLVVVTDGKAANLTLF